MSEPSEALNDKLPEVSIIRLLNVATPNTAWAVSVVPPPAKTPPVSVSVTVDVSLVTTLPFASCTATWTEVPRAVPAVPLVGVCVKASLLESPVVVGYGLIEMLFDAAPVSEPSLALSE